jgi:lysophospholipase L1-like esterase
VGRPGLRLAGVEPFHARCHGDLLVAVPNWQSDSSEAPAPAVIAAFGVNDMNSFYCSVTLADFQGAIGSICQQLKSDLPAATVYLSAILPNPGLESRRADWNRAIRTAAATYGCVYADPSAAIDPATDLYDGLHPNLQGHTKLAHFWTQLLG